MPGDTLTWQEPAQLLQVRSVWSYNRIEVDRWIEQQKEASRVGLSRHVRTRIRGRKARGSEDTQRRN